MTEIFAYKDIIILGILIGIFVIILFALLLFYEQTRRRRYDETLMHAELEKLRESYEHKMYDIMNRLTSTEERWRDLNHLIISAQKSIPDRMIDQSVHISTFLKYNGVGEEDTVIQKDLVFVLTPFHQDYSETYSVIEKACRNSGLRCLRGDEENITEIFPHILRLIVKARLIIANIDGRNPNVFYELGIAHSIDKPIIIISSAVYPDGSPDQLIDVRSKRMILYKDYKELADLLTKELPKALI
jgi:hypothetical protein